MQNITVRFSLMGVLALFSFMLALGAGVGLYAIDQSNESTSQVYQISSQIIGINDAYKDTTRTRAALTRAYSTLKEGGDVAGIGGALSSAKTSYDRTLAQLVTFERAAAYAGQDAALKTELIAAGRTLSVTLDKARAALVANDTAAYTVVNNKEITVSGAAFTTALEKFQKLGRSQIDDLVAQRAHDFTLVVWLVVVGLGLAMALVVAVHLMLKSIVLNPLNRAVVLLDQVALGDLTERIGATGNNEIGRLLAAIERMQQGLLKTVSEVRTGSDIINTGAQEIAAGNMDLSTRTESQASALEQTAASMEELTSTVKQNAENARQANTLVLAASGTAVKGGEVMGHMVDTMSAINDSSRKIVDIISVIDGIAFQTNILALNAAVEAARAGEQGRGFAVVATEVRNLAQRSAAAAREIKSLIDDSVQKVDSGSKLVEQAGLTMSEVVTSVQRVTDIVSEIAAASQEQSEGIEQVNKAITQMDEVTQQNAALVEEAAAATQSLQSQATALAAPVAVFKVDHAATMAATRPVSALAPATPRLRPAVRPAAPRAALARAVPARPAPAPPRRAASGKTAQKAEASEWEEF